jgi:hypothetical protein
MVLLIIAWALLVVGLGLMSWGLTYTLNVHHKEVISTRTYFSKDISSYIYVKYVTTDAFVTGNPIDVTVNTGIVQGIDYIQLTFDGAGTYFPQDYDFSSTSPADMERLQESLRNSLNNVIPLQKQVSTVGIVTFSGKASGLVYSQGGNFDIGITFQQKGSGVMGYEMGQRNYKIPSVVSISPPEALLTIRNNNLMVGISLIAVGASFFIPSLTKIVFGS